MDPDTFFITSFILLLISFITGMVVLTVVCCCLKHKEILMKVFPYIKKSGNHVVIFGFVITKRLFIFQWFYMMYAFVWILFIVLFNTLFTFSYTYNPYDKLNCFASYNGSVTELVSEEQAEMENVAGIMCYGWNLNIGGAIGHAAAILALSWIFSSFVLWAKLHLLHLVKNFNNKYLDKCSNVAFFLFHFTFFMGSLTMLFVCVLFFNQQNIFIPNLRYWIILRYPTFRIHSIPKS
uniref:Uncharacterized protein n=1 Tax=Amphimedon queenslandica TaxID=400682 RepID=A0A1X7TIM0_AMPQE